MSQPFLFPPPPPPPPKRGQVSSTENLGAFRGRGSGRGQYNHGLSQSVRGRGSHSNVNSHRGRANFSTRPHAAKRDFATAFSKPVQAQSSALPVVPSFNVDVKALLPNKPPVVSADTSKRKSNLLGLTPTDHDVSDPEDDADVDEEAKSVTAHSSGGIQFEHKGQRLSLSTPAEIAAWIAERKKRFPTQAKAEAAKQEAAEKRKRWMEEKKAHAAVLKLKKEARERERSENERRRLKEKLLAAQITKAKSTPTESKEDVALKAKLKAENLKKKAEKAARDLKRAEQQLQQLEHGESPDGTRKEDNYASDSVTTSSIESDLEETSSSGSSDNETDVGFDDGPQESTSKQTGPERVAPPRQDVQRGSNEGPPICKNLMKHGRCKYGKKCRFSHKVPKEKPSNASSSSTRRRGLYQVLVEKEKEEELQRALRTIICLGDQGLLDEAQREDLPL